MTVQVVVQWSDVISKVELEKVSGLKNSLVA